MLNRSLVYLAAVFLLLVPASSVVASDGHQSADVAGVHVANDDQHETRVALPAEDGTGRWLAPIEGEVPAVNLAVMPGGDLLYFSGVEADDTEDGPTDLQFIYSAHPINGRSRVMSLDDGTGERGASVLTPDPVDGGYYDLFCSGTTITPEGTAVVPGATEYYTLDQDVPENLYTPLKGWNQTMLFGNDPVGDEDLDWVRGPNMSVHRWYPSALQLPNGDTMVASGIQTLFFPNTYNTLVETYNPDTEAGWEGMDTYLKIADGVSVPQEAIPPIPGTGVAFVDETHRGVPNLPMYPRLNVIPSGPNGGEVLYGASGDVWGPFGEHPNQELFSHFQTLDTRYGTWEVHERSMLGTRNLGTTVPLMEDATDDDAEAKYLSFGGTIQQTTAATSTAEIIDASRETISSTPTEPMHFPRWSVNGVLLPDGSVLSIGGSMYDNVVLHGSPTAGPLNIERFVPNEDGTDGTWELLPPMEDVRAYHSSAVLLPDARVLVGGHVPLPAFHDAQRENGNPQPRNSSFEIYEPEYLFHGDESRPDIAEGLFGASGLGNVVADVQGTPELRAGFGDVVSIPVTGLDGELDSVTLMRPGATTHQYNADQMGVELELVGTSANGPDGSTVLDVKIPGDLALAPGHYMVFVNEDTNGDADGGFFPSQAAWIGVGDDVDGDAPHYEN